MTPERWERIEKLYHAARARAEGDRAAFLAEACAGDDELRRKVQELLDQPVSTAGFVDFLGGPAPALPARTQTDTGASLLTGRRLGVYQVQALLGRGGMGDVYRAHDTRLGRDVAIKVLPRAFTADPDRLARFEREARVVAALSHPNIAAIHGVEESAGVLGLVLELVEGPTLAERLARGPLPIAEALSIARQIAEALEAAHEKGITHRDLKPSNVKITPDGVVKLLDFGIAKVVTGDGTGIDLSQAPTARATVEGLIIGTAGYMSPEQARGKPVDKRADIWAFGCVLYEMLSGRMAFEGDTLSDTIAAILERSPDWTTLQASTPLAVHRLLQRCLDKDPKQRLRDIGDARVELEEIIRGPVEEGAAPAQTKKLRTSRLAAAAAAAVVLVLAGALGARLLGERVSPSDRRVSRFTVNLPQGQWMTPTLNANLALSPDGTRLAFTPLPGPVYIRQLDGLESRPLEVSTSPGFRSGPVFSPDGASISFVEGNAIFSWARPFLKAALSGGAAVKLADYDAFHRGDWGADGWIYWTAAYPGGIVRIRDSGGQIEPVTELNVQEGERSHRFAKLLPDERALIYTVGFEGISSYDDARIDLWDLETGKKKTLIAGGMSATYSPSGHIVYARTGKLFAVPFDLARREVTGSAFEVLDGVMMSRNTGSADFTLSARGDLAYVPGPAEGGHRTLVWVDRSGKAEPLPLPPASYLYPRISPDGRTLAVEIEGPNHDFYFYDFSRGVLSKVTTDGLSHDPVWTPDGKRLAFRSWQSGGMTMWWMPADRSAGPERLDPAGTRQSPVSFSPDGKFLAFDQKDSQTQDDAWVLPLEGNRTPQPVAKSKFGEGSMKFSPNGRWVAYSSNESGKAEVYVQAFPGPGPKVQISSDGGFDPVWRRSGGELYYRSGNKMMAVSITTSPELKASAPKMLWEGSYSAGSGSSCGMVGVSSSNYDVTSDGQRFLMVRDGDITEGEPTAGGGVARTRIVVVLNWVEELKAKERARSQATTATAGLAGAAPRNRGI